MLEIQNELDSKAFEKHFKDGYKIGSRVDKADVAKRDALILDLSSKSNSLITELLEKESKEEELACYGNIHFIHKTFDQVKAHLKSDIKRYKKERHKIKSFLDEIVEMFKGIKGDSKMYMRYLDGGPHAKQQKNMRALLDLS